MATTTTTTNVRVATTTTTTTSAYNNKSNNNNNNNRSFYMVYNKYKSDSKCSLISTFVSVAVSLNRSCICIFLAAAFVLDPIPVSAVGSETT